MTIKEGVRLTKYELRSIEKKIDRSVELKNSLAFEYDERQALENYIEILKFQRNRLEEFLAKQ